MKIPSARHQLQTSLLALLLLAWPPVHAATPDQRIYLEADEVDIDEKHGVSTYQGKVKLTRGPITMEAEIIKAYKNAQGLQRMVATGTPVRFTKSADNGAATSGEALEIELDAVGEILTLRKQASLKQANNLFNGHIIIYNSARETVVASKGTEQKSRVQVILQPDQPRSGKSQPEKAQ